MMTSPADLARMSTPPAVFRSYDDGDLPDEIHADACEIAERLRQFIGDVIIRRKSKRFIRSAIGSRTLLFYILLDPEGVESLASVARASGLSRAAVAKIAKQLQEQTGIKMVRKIRNPYLRRGNAPLQLRDS